MSTAAWPPPPDLASIKELVRDADIEGFIADGSPQDEYDHEAEQLYATIANFSTSELTAVNLLPVLEPIWSGNFNIVGTELDQRRPALLTLAQQIARFFGPVARPQTRERPV